MQRIVTLDRKKSFFLFGSRQTGKSTLVKSLLEQNDLYINLLPYAEFLKYNKDPSLFHSEVLFHFKKHGGFLCIVDEVQKLPELLNDVHDLIESTEVKFILTGSSARSLRNKGINLLAGRAISKFLYPFIYKEIAYGFSIERAMLYGMLPKVWNGELENHTDLFEFLASYSQTYLREEIQQEGVVRKLGSFSRFLDISSVNDGQIVNFSTIARECGVSVKTIQGYYEILEDTFLAYRIDGWSKSIRKQLTSHPKYYFFDCGITNALCYLNKEKLGLDERGRRFEQFMVTQMIALNNYFNLGYQFFHWRDKNNQEVDLLVTKNLEIVYAIEFKSSINISSSDLKGLLAFKTENKDVPCYIISPTGKPREMKESIIHYNWQDFFEKIFLHMNL